MSAVSVSGVSVFGVPWSPGLGRCRTPELWWHGDADHIIPFAHGVHMVGLLPRAELRVMAGESHLGGLGIAQEILGTLLKIWDARPGPWRQGAGPRLGRCQATSTKTRRTRDLCAEMPSAETPSAATP